MKKFISGLVVGMLLMLGGTVFAEEIQSLIGKTIQGQFPVTVDGQQLEMPAIVVDGTSFLPVRSFGESVGYNVYFDPQGAIYLNKQTPALLQERVQNQGAQFKAANIDALQRRIEYLQQRINDLDIEKARKTYIEMGGDPAKYEQTPAYKARIQELQSLQTELQQKQTDLQQLQTQN